MWPDCSPPSVAPVFSISSNTYLSPTLARNMRMPEFFKRNLESHIRHGRGDDGIGLQLVLRMQIARGGKQHTIAIHNTACGVAEQGAVGVAVKGHTQIKLPWKFRDHLSERLRDATRHSLR